MTDLAWGARVSRAFRIRVSAICDMLQINPDWLMACIAFESGETFSPSVRNAAGSGAVGLIQFMPSTATALGTTTEELAAMDELTQLSKVEAYFRSWRCKLHNLGDVYGAILWPGMIGKPDDYVLFDRADAAHPKRYLQNAGLDFNKDGKVTREEAVSRVRAKLEKGRLPENAAPIS